MDARNPALVPAAGVDAGLRAYLLRTYDYVGIGLGVAALTAYGVLSLATTTTAAEGAKAFGAGRWLTPAGQVLFSVPATLAMLVVSLLLLKGMSDAVRSNSRLVALGAYVLFTATFGLNLAVMAASYAASSVTFALATTAGTFAGTSLWAHATRRDLSGWGAFLGMGLLGLVVAMVGGLLLGAAGPFETAVAAVGVLLFTGLIAYDTQALRRAYSPAMTAGDRDRAALWGAVDLFLDAVNLFQFVLMLGGSKDD